MIQIWKLANYIENVGKGIVSWVTAHRGLIWQAATVTLVDGAALTVDCTLGETFAITCANDNVRAFALPTNLQAGGIFRTCVINTSGGPLTQTTWNANYSPANPTLPATGNRRYQTWTWDGTKAYLVSQTAADVAN